MNTGYAKSITAPQAARPIRRKFLPWIVVLFIASLPFEQILGMLVGITTELKPYRALLPLVVLLALVQNNKFLQSARQISFGFIIIFSYGLLLVAAWGAVGQVSLPHTQRTLLLVSIGGAIFFSLIKIIKTSDSIDKLFLIFSFSVFASIIIWKLGLNLSGLYRFTGFFRNPNHFAYALSIAIIYFASRSLRDNETTKFRVMWITLSLPLLYFLVVSGSRGGLLGLAAGLFLVGVRVIGSRSKGKQGKKIFLLAMVFGAALAGASIMQELNFSERIMHRFSSEVAMQGSGRLDIWTAGLNASFDYYFIGMGMEQYISNHAYYINQLAFVKSDTLLKFDLSQHSEFMTLFVEYGLFGFAIFLFIVRKIWVGLTRKSPFQKSTSDIPVFLQALFVSGLVQALFQTMNFFPLHWLILGACVAYINVSETWLQQYRAN